jgi:hypothetical protein
MSDIWNTLIQIQDKLIDKFETTGYEIEEPGMNRFNQPGWINRVWTSDQYRRAHIDVVDARETKGIWMMHCCVFPRLNNNGPIFGLDVIAGKTKITGFFHDFSPTIEPNHVMIQEFRNSVSNLTWNKTRVLPDWALAIFTDHMIAASNINSNAERDQLLKLSFESINYYLDNIAKYNHEGDIDEIKAAQNKYVFYQKQNPHNARTMTALGLDEEDVQVFVQQCLFPDID